jgi:His-Xaa-Ser system protein HxsD
LGNSAPNIEIALDVGLYTQSAILKASYKFTGTCYVSMTTAPEGPIVVAFISKTPGSLPDNLKEEFLNELLDQRLRELISEETLPVRNLILAHALSKLDLLHTSTNETAPSHDGDKIPRK